jgi:hypothetical protein
MNWVVYSPQLLARLSQTVSADPQYALSHGKEWLQSGAETAESTLSSARPKIGKANDTILEDHARKYLFFIRIKKGYTP